MHTASSRTSFFRTQQPGARTASNGFASLILTCAVTLCTALTAPSAAVADSHVEFDIVRAVECRDVTPHERIAQYPAQRLIEVALPVSVRFHEIGREDVDEIHIEVSGASAGLRVLDFAPMTQLASEITREIETTTTNKKTRMFEGTLGGSLPIPGAEAAAHISPSITAGASGCESAVEKINRLPPKHVVVVSGTLYEGRGVFFKLKRTSQTSLEGVHEMAVTFVAPRTWPAIALQVKCSALGERKMLWMRQSATLGDAQRFVHLVPAAPPPIRQIVLKPTDADEASFADTSAASPTKWRPVRLRPAATKTADRSDMAQKLKKLAEAAAGDSGDVEIALDAIDKN
jgi:hypothetical protein